MLAVLPIPLISQQYHLLCSALNPSLLHLLLLLEGLIELSSSLPRAAVTGAMVLRLISQPLTRPDGKGYIVDGFLVSHRYVRIGFYWQASHQKS